MEKTYLLLELNTSDIEKVAQQVLGSRGVIRIDILEGTPQMLLLLGCSSRTKLSDSVIDLLEKLDREISDATILPVATRETVELARSGLALRQR